MTVNESNASRTSTPMPLSSGNTPSLAPLPSTYYMSAQPTASCSHPCEKTINIPLASPNDINDTYTYSRTTGGSFDENNFY